ncbi:unnamed protein product [Rotaria magnacalcarata]
MGQHLSNVNLKLVDWASKDGTKLAPDAIIAGNGQENISPFVSMKTLADTTTNQILSSEKLLIKQIQNYLLSLSKANKLVEINAEINKILMETCFVPIIDRYRSELQGLKNIVDKQQELQKHFKKTIREKNTSLVETATSIGTIEKSTVANEMQHIEANEVQPFSCFAINLLASLLLVSIKAQERIDPSIATQIITSASPLVEQIPIRNLSSDELSSNANSLMSKSLAPLISYINELSMSEDHALTRPAVQILLTFSIAHGSFKDLLPIISRLIFNSTDIYNVRDLITKMNNQLTETINQFEQSKTIAKSTTDELSLISLDYLKLNGVFPNAKLAEIDDTIFTSEFISSIILAYVDIYNEINLNKQYQHGTMHSSISFEFHPNTFKQLFYILARLTAIMAENPKPVLNHILTVCVRLFKTHLRFLSSMKSTIERELLATTEDELIKVTQDISNENADNIDLSTFVNNDELSKWSDILLQLACDDQKSERAIMCKEASKALIYVMHLKATSFTENLSFIHKYIIENKHPILVEQFITELNRTVTLCNWVEISSRDNTPENSELSTVLYSFIDLFFNPTSIYNDEQNQQIQQVLMSFQQFFLVRLVPPSRMKKIQNQATDNNKLDEFELSIDKRSALFFAQHITYILRNHLNRMSRSNDLMNQIFVGLCLMTQTEIFSFTTVQPMFTSILPLLADYLLIQSVNNEENTLHGLYWLMGKMSNVLITGSEQNLLEREHVDELKLSLLTGGCEKTAIDNNKYLSSLYESNLAVYSKISWANQNQLLSSDHDFLMTVHENTCQGAELIKKIKIYVKNQPHLLKSIEEQVNGACAALFAVYLKHYRRVNIAKLELSRTDDRRPHHKLISLFEYACQIQTLFITTKAQDGDCDALYKQIKMKTLFLLSIVKESNFIPIIQDDLSQIRSNTKSMIDVEQKPAVALAKESSRWKTAKHIFTILRHTLHACIRFKKMMLAKRRAVEQNQDIESILNKEIHSFVCSHRHEKMISIASEKTKSECDELAQCIIKQYERAITRLMTYRFINTFIQKTLTSEDNKRTSIILSIFSPYLRKSEVNWFYLENIQVTNDELKEEIRNNYYSIGKNILSLVLQSKIGEQNMFNLLNVSHTAGDIYLLRRHQFVEILFKTYVSFVDEKNRPVSIHTKLIGYNWFRLYVLEVCRNVQIEESNRKINEELIGEENFLFKTLVLSDLKGLRQLKQTLSNDTQETIADSVECRYHSLKNVSIGWFIHATTKEKTADYSKSLSSKFEIELCTNQWLSLLLRCVHLYEHVRTVCGTIDFIEELLYVYRNSQNQATILLALKILRDLLPLLPETTNESTSSKIRILLNEFLFSIGDSYTSQTVTSETLTELIYIYRTIMSYKSPWQMMARQLVFDSITSSSTTIDWKSLETISTKQWNYLLASLFILGGYIQPYGLGSIVEIYIDDENNEYELGIIIDIDTNARDLVAADSASYFIQYLEEDKTEWVKIDKLQVKLDVSAAKLFAFSNTCESNTDINSILDTLGYIIQLDTSSTDSLRLLQLKRYSITALYWILTNNQIIDIFMEKPYASLVAQLSMADSLSENQIKPADLLLFNRSHLEQYCFSLDRCERLKQIINNSSENAIIENTQIDSSPGVHKRTRVYNKWKPFASKFEIELYKKGRNGNDDISIVPFPNNIADLDVIEECGTNHRFKGRIHMTSQNQHGAFPSFIVENLQLSHGNWYYCIRLSTAGLVQMGWATAGFAPESGEGQGIGDDTYSWSFDGSRGTLYNNQEFQFLPQHIQWTVNDVCGCGIEIDGENTRIKYWLNGKFLGTVFEHQSNIASTTIKCNLLPNGPNTTYFPGVTIQARYDGEQSCEFIFSPEDMIECPLPEGYKPILMPKLIHKTESLVAYPYSAYLVGDDVQEFIYTPRRRSSTGLLRDFINEQHIETKLPISDNQLLLNEDGDGFPFSIVDNSTSSLTISFDFRILNANRCASNGNLDIPLFKLQETKEYSVQIPFSKKDESIRTVILIDTKERQIKIFINNNCQITDDAFDNATMTKFNFHFLPNMNAGIKNFAVWKYALSEDRVRRLFTSGVFYVAMDYTQVNEYRLQANRFTFMKNQQEFQNKFLVPMNEPFDETLWTQKQVQADNDESKYFKSIAETNESVVQLYGHKSYLVAKKSASTWKNYTIVLDISIPDFPSRREQLTLVLLNPATEIFISSEGKLCVSTADSSNESESTLSLNQWMRLVISVDNKFIRSYVDGLLLFLIEITDDSLAMSPNQFHLFREVSLRQNKIFEDTLRIECKSITYFNRSIVTLEIDEILKSPNYSLESLVALPYSEISTNLIDIGYKFDWIKSVMNEYKTSNIQLIDAIIRENNNELVKKDEQKRKKCILNILSTLGSSIDREKLEYLIDNSLADTDDQVTAIGELVLTNWNDLQASTSCIVEKEIDEGDVSTDQTENKWFRRTINKFGSNYGFTEWIQDKSSKTESMDDTYQLFDYSKSKHEQTIAATGLCDQRTKIEKSIQYSHKNISYKEYSDSRIACENGLISIYAREIILNILKFGSMSRSSHGFPLEKLGDYPFIVKLLRSIDNHYTYASIRFDDSVHTVSSLVKSILKNEMKQLIVNTNEALSSKVPLFYYLQKDMIVRSILYLLKLSSSMDESDDISAMIYERTKSEEPNLNFTLKMLNLFAELVTDKLTIEHEQMDATISIVFSESLINVMFNLFLLFPKHKSKSFILQLFVTLMQANENFSLNKRIQDFITQLLIVLLSDESSMDNRTMKTLRSTIMDFVFLDLTKNKRQLGITNNLKKQFEFKLSEFPQNFQDLWMVIDIVNALMDKTKKTPYPESLLIQSFDILDDDLQFCPDDIVTLNSCFDDTSDLQLISLMNNDALIEHSFGEFLHSLAITYMSNSVYSELYPALSHISSYYIQNRAKLFHLLEIFVEKLLPLLDLSLAPKKSIVTDKIRLAKNYLSNRKRMAWLEYSLLKTKTTHYNNFPTVQFDFVLASSIDDDGRHSMFHQGYEQLHTNAHLLFRSKNERLWRAQYVGMHSSDQGGPYRDSITSMCADICSTRLPLFILCPNGRTGSGLNGDRWIPNVFPPNQSIPATIKKQYRFIGQLMGMAIRRKHYLDLKFPNLLWKQLVDEPITMNDIEAIDIQSFAIIKEMEKNLEKYQFIDVGSDTNYLFSSVMSEFRFDIVSSSGHTYELIPGGKDIPITADNFKEYCMRYRDYRLTEFRRQIDYIRQGLCSVVPNDFMTLLTSSELEEAVCGKGQIDIELLKRNTKCNYSNSEAQCVQRFWKVLSEMFNEEQKKLFLKFVWGRNTLPSRDEYFTENFSINLLMRNQCEADRMLPRSHTCSFVLHLPSYSTVEIMYERLNYAITHCSSIDTDG